MIFSLKSVSSMSVKSIISESVSAISVSFSFNFCFCLFDKIIANRKKNNRKGKNFLIYKNDIF